MTNHDFVHAVKVIRALVEEAMKRNAPYQTTDTGCDVKQMLQTAIHKLEELDHRLVFDIAKGDK